MRYSISTTELHCSTIKRGSATNSKRTSNRSINPYVLYDYVLRCAILAWIEQNKRDSKKRTSFYANLLARRDRLSREVTRILCKKLEDTHQDTSTCPDVRSTCKTLLLDLDEGRRYIDDVADLFLQADKSIKGTLFSSLMLQTLQEEEVAVTQEILEKLLHSEKINSRKRSSTLSGSCPLEEFPIIIYIKELFKIQDHEHKKKLYELTATCTETVKQNKLKHVIVIIIRMDLGLILRLEELHRQYPHKSFIFGKTRRLLYSRSL